MCDFIRLLLVFQLFLNLLWLQWHCWKEGESFFIWVIPAVKYIWREWVYKAIFEIIGKDTPLSHEGWVGYKRVFALNSEQWEINRSCSASPKAEDHDKLETGRETLFKLWSERRETYQTPGSYTDSDWSICQAQAWWLPIKGQCNWRGQILPSPLRRGNVSSPETLPVTSLEQGALPWEVAP